MRLTGIYAYCIFSMRALIFESMGCQSTVSAPFSNIVSQCLRRLRNPTSDHGIKKRVRIVKDVRRCTGGFQCTQKRGIGSDRSTPHTALRIVTC